MTMSHQWSDDPPSGLPALPFSHFQTLEYAAVLPRYGQRPLWLTVQMDREVVATWLFYRTPANYLAPPGSRLRRKLDVHLQATHSPVWADALTEEQRGLARRLMLQALIEETDKSGYITVRVVLDPTLAPSTRSDWISAAEQLTLRTSPSHTYAVRLPEKSSDLFASLKADRRTKVRKAEREDPAFEEVGDLRGLRAYHAVRCETTARNSIADVPWEYFETTFSMLNPSGIYKVFLARFGGRVGAGQALFCWNGYVYLAGVSIASWAKEERIPANDYLQWKVLEWAVENGHDLVDFVGAQPDSKDEKIRTIDAFKSRWGTSLYESLAIEYPPTSIRRQARRAANRVVRNFLS